MASKRASRTKNRPNIGHDFFLPQPSNAASVFLVKNVIHNWSNPNAHKILTNLRNAAQPDTILLICDIVMTYSCREPSPAITKDHDYTLLDDPSLIAPDILSTGFNSVTDMVWLLDATVCVDSPLVELPRYLPLFPDVAAFEHPGAHNRSV